ncbi:thioredoxin-like protein, putative [Theileria annulata]|uniref:Thioredoxin-like protein, putative n=1 Tax=Theileria annulata TaxID=5874 RepID=Q4UCM6_THEAN|nr:thioredoxin-like protein, putative [Theileria annulata]CAI75425.1 thioredoxin-like protein, putative [Theileria annulata]|eukprot:XP_954901.1 thioredoxin-like protein, putative [Theileria annulata]
MYRNVINNLKTIKLNYNLNNLNNVRNVRNFVTNVRIGNLPNNKILLKFVKVGFVSALFGSAGYIGYNLSSIPLNHIDEETFDGKDDLVVVILENKTKYSKQEIERLKSVLPKNISLFYTIKKSNTGMSVMLYKGMRKKYYQTLNLLDDKVLKEFSSEVNLFFQPQSEEIHTFHDSIPQFVTYNSFNKDVIEESKKAPILLQLFEENCFLCFLIRPFINSVNKLLISTNNPLRIKRLNIELNDFPKGCPITRATPTFVYYDKGSNGVKWDEFKPKDFSEKLFKTTVMDENSKKYIEELAEKIPERFMLFGKLALWLSESQKMQELIFKSQSNDFELTSDEDLYNKSISLLMEIVILVVDMKRIDDLEENLENLKVEIDSAEKDCLAIAQIMALDIIKSETNLVS